MHIFKFMLLFRGASIIDLRSLNIKKHVIFLI